VGLDWYLIATTDLPGVLNFLAFCMDPALANALRQIKDDMLEKYGDQGTIPPSQSDHRFARWITKNFLSGTKKVDEVSSPFYRMSATEHLTKEFGPDSNISSPDEYLSYPTTAAATAKNDSQFTMIQIPERQAQAYEMSKVRTAAGTPTKRKYSEDEDAKKVFRGL
jgi:hypothetical protein